MTIFLVNAMLFLVLDLAVIDDPNAAAVALEPVRNRLLAELRQPASAASVASRLGIPRQRATYHLKALEAHGLVKPAGQKQWGGLTERLFKSTAASYVIAPRAMGEAGPDPRQNIDRLSASYLIALAARAVQEVGDLLRRARAAEKNLATLSVDTEIRFRTAQERAAFTGELTQMIATLAGRYHDPDLPGGRAHRLVVLAHPCPGPAKEI